MLNAAITRIFAVSRLHSYTLISKQLSFINFLALENTMNSEQGVDASDIALDTKSTIEVSAAPANGDLVKRRRAWYTAVLMSLCYGVGELSHFLVGTTSRAMSQDLQYGDQSCQRNDSLSVAGADSIANITCSDYVDEDTYENISFFCLSHINPTSFPLTPTSIPLCPTSSHFIPTFLVSYHILVYHTIPYHTIPYHTTISYHILVWNQKCGKKNLYSFCRRTAKKPNSFPISKLTASFFEIIRLVSIYLYYRCNKIITEETAGSSYCQWDYNGLGIEYQILAGPRFHHLTNL